MGCNVMMVLVGFTVMLEKPMSADVPSCFTIAMVDQKLRSLEWLAQHDLDVQLASLPSSH